MTVFLNNSRRRDQVKIYNSVEAFFDLGTEVIQATQAVGLTPGTECVVATPVGDYEIRFTWFAFSHEATMPDDLKEQCRVFFGKRLRSEKLPKSKAVKTEPYNVFFTEAGGFKADVRSPVLSASKPMTYRVTCADRDTGVEYTVDVEAATASQATNLAASQGHLASRAESIPEPTPGDLIAHQILQAIHHEQMHTRVAVERIARSRLVRAPIGTIAVSIIVAMILWGVLCFLLFMAFGALLAGAGMAAGAGR